MPPLNGETRDFQNGNFPHGEEQVSAPKQAAEDFSGQTARKWK